MTINDYFNIFSLNLTTFYEGIMNTAPKVAAQAVALMHSGFSQRNEVHLNRSAAQGEEI